MIKRADFGRISGGIRRQLNIRTRNQLYIFLICLAIAVFVWFLIKLSKNYSATLHCSVYYTQVPADKVLVHRSDSVIRLRVRATGFGMLSLRHRYRNLEAAIDLSQIPLKPYQNGFIASVKTNRLLQQIGAGVGLENNLERISPDTLYFRFEDRKVAKLPVVINNHIAMTFQKQYMLYDSISYTPDSVMVSGTQQQLSDLQSVSISPVELSGLSSPVELTLPLQKLPGGVFVDTDSIRLSIPVAQYTESAMMLPVEQLFADSLQQIRTFPDRVEVSFLVALHDYPSLSPQMFQAGVNLKEEQDKNSRLKVHLNRYPPYIRNVRISPAEVEYIILR